MWAKVVSARRSASYGCRGASRLPHVTQRTFRFLLALNEVKPDTGGHERARDPNLERKMFAETNGGDERPDEGCGGKVSSGARCADVAKGDDETNETQAVGDKANASAAPRLPPEGRCAPAESASVTLTMPAAMPFSAAVENASACETLRVRLLSMPQQAHAATMRSAAGQRLKPSALVQLSAPPPKTIRKNPAAILRASASSLAGLSHPTGH